MKGRRERGELVAAATAAGGGASSSSSSRGGEAGVRLQPDENCISAAHPRPARSLVDLISYR